MQNSPCHSNQSKRPPIDLPPISPVSTYDLVNDPSKTKVGSTSGQSTMVVGLPEASSKTLDKTNTVQPNHPIDEEEYAEINQPTKGGEKAQKSLNNLEVVDASQIQPKLNRSATDGYEEMSSLTNDNVKEEGPGKNQANQYQNLSSVADSDPHLYGKTYQVPKTR